MDNSAWSVASLGLDGDSLMCVDPVAAAQAINRVINKMTDGEVAVSVDSHGLNVRSSARELRNRLEWHLMRRHFGFDAAPWIPSLMNDPRCLS